MFVYNIKKSMNSFAETTQFFYFDMKGHIKFWIRSSKLLTEINKLPEIIH